jgi:hypothetical protein
MAQRTVEDRLREEHFLLLPETRRVLEELEAKVRHCLMWERSLLRDGKIEQLTAKFKTIEEAFAAF